MGSLHAVVRPLPQPSQPKTHRWQFPLGEKMAVLYIESMTELNMDDMDDLIKICVLFRKSIKKRQPMQEDYSI